jgi:hypothetical protein
MFSALLPAAVRWRMVVSAQVVWMARRQLQRYIDALFSGEMIVEGNRHDGCREMLSISVLAARHVVNTNRRENWNKLSPKESLVEHSTSDAR